MQKNLPFFEARTLKLYLYILIGIAVFVLGACNREEPLPTINCADGSSPPCTNQQPDPDPINPVSPVNPVGNYFGTISIENKKTALGLIVKKGAKADVFVGQLESYSNEPNQPNRPLDMNCTVFNTNQMACTGNDSNTTVIMIGSISANKYVGSIDFNMLTFNISWQGSFDLNLQ